MVTKDGDKWVVTFPIGALGDTHLEEALLHVYVRKYRVMAERHKKYGPNNIAEGKRAGILVRALDKHTRLNNGGESFNDEDEEDAWIDLSNYGDIGLLWIEGDWPRAHVVSAAKTCRSCGHPLET